MRYGGDFFINPAIPYPYTTSGSSGAEDAASSNLYLLQVPELEMADLMPIGRTELILSDIITGKMSKKYTCHVVSTGFIAILIVFATNCNPLGHSELTQIAQQYFNASCYVASFKLELPELPNHSPLPSHKLDAVVVSGTASNASLSYSPSPSPEAPEV